ncbi:MAG: TonB-dependent receptor, partial [Cyclobacteriaceae bacterium]
YQIDTEPDDILVFSYVGYGITEVPIEGRDVIDVTLSAEALMGGEIVVVGYGVQEKATLTGSVTQVGGANLEKSPTVGFSNSFSGRMPGLVALNRTGEPGEDFSNLLIRGRSTLGNTNPLIVIDGVAGREGLNSINPRDVESVSILKDASAAIYGAQAANGVILVTTKRGETGKPTIRYSANQGFLQPTRTPEMADAATYADFLNYQVGLYNQSPVHSEEDIQKFRNGTDPLTHPNTDWIDEGIKDFNTQSQQSLSIGGGSDNVRYYVSGNYSNQNGIFKNGTHNYNVLGGRVNIDTDVTENLMVSVDLSVSEDNQHQPNSSSLPYRGYPTQTATYENGLPGYSLDTFENPVYLASDVAGFEDNKTNLYQTSVSFEYELPFVEGLGIDGRISYDKVHADSKEWEKPYTLYGYDSETDTYLPNSGGPSMPQLEQRMRFSSMTNGNIRIKYSTEIKDHKFDAFAAVEQTEHNSNFLEAFRKNYQTTVVNQIFAGSSVNMNTDGSASKFTRRNYFGRFGYHYKGKYLVDFTVRYDGSSAFPKDGRFGFFPGVSAGWVISEEAFFQGVDFVNHLKFRGSWGQMGNDAIAPFQYLATYNLNSRGAVFGTDKTLRQGTSRSVEPNPNITWEVAKTSNIGLDAELWEGRLNLTLDAFQTKRSNILASRNASIPRYTGLELPDENIGIVENKGFEFQLEHRRIINNDFTYAIRGNMSYSRNKIIHIDEAADIPEWQKAEGMPMGSDLYYNAIGIFRSQQEIDSSPAPSGTRVNDLQYEDVNGDGEINALDRKRLSKSPIPEIVFGSGISLWYNNFELDILLQGQARAWRYFYMPQGIFGNVLQDFAENRPGPDNPDSKLPNIYSDEGEVGAWDSNFWLYNASFLRLKNVELGYSIPADLTDQLGIQNVRVYVNGLNLMTFDKFDYFDPEGLGGNRASFYPQNRVFNIGINISI